MSKDFQEFILDEYKLYLTDMLYQTIYEKIDENGDKQYNLRIIYKNYDNLDISIPIEKIEYWSKNYKSIIRDKKLKQLGI